VAYRDDLEAASERAAALQQELDEAKAENERLKREASDAAPEREARDALARDQRGRREAEARYAARQAADQALQPVRALRWFKRASSPFGFTRYGWFYYGLPLMMFFPAYFAALMFGEKRMGWFLLGSVALTALLVGVGLALSAAAGARALEWLERLPFKVTDLVECFGDRTYRWGRVRLTITWRDAGPDSAWLSKFLGGAASVTGNRLEVEFTGNKSELAGLRALYQTLRLLIDGALVPIHRQHEIAEVRFEPRD
jgi:hypothetical protein